MLCVFAPVGERFPVESLQLITEGRSARSAAYTTDEACTPWIKR